MTMLDTSPARTRAPIASEGDVRSPILRRVLRWAARLQAGRLTLIVPDGRQYLFAGPAPGPQAVLRLHRTRAMRRLLLGGRLGFCAAYLDGDWSSPDPGALFELALRNEDALASVLAGRRWVRLLHRLAHLVRPNSRRGSRRNIAHHYDLGNDFYAAWLDPTMTYSAALFADPDRPEPLAIAQRRKYAALARRLDLRPGHHLLEIGCGWGGFAAFAARECGARVTAITVSRAQHAYASRRIQEAGLAERVDIRLCDYRDIGGLYDRIAAIEMFEAVGECYWPVFFRVLRDRLVTGGRAALQVITIAEDRFPDYRRGTDYIQRYIFPGGMLPPPSALPRLAADAALAWLDSESFGPHYARTLAEWRARFTATWPRLAAMGFDDRFRRMWELYLHYCEAGFRTGTIDVMQLALARP